MRIAYYTTATGFIRQVMSFMPGTVVADYDDYIGAGESMLEDTTNTIDPELHYVLAGVKTDRPVLNLGVDEVLLAANGVATITFTIPGLTTVMMDYEGVLYTAGASPEAFTVQSAIVGEFVFDIVPPFPTRELLLRVTTYAV